jgi:hypothetical protein
MEIGVIKANSLVHISGEKEVTLEDGTKKTTNLHLFVNMINVEAVAFEEEE